MSRADLVYVLTWTDEAKDLAVKVYRDYGALQSARWDLFELGVTTTTTVTEITK